MYYFIDFKLLKGTKKILKNNVIDHNKANVLYCFMQNLKLIWAAKSINIKE